MQGLKFVLYDLSDDCVIPRVTTQLIKEIKKYRIGVATYVTLGTKFPSSRRWILNCRYVYYERN